MTHAWSALLSIEKRLATLSAGHHCPAKSLFSLPSDTIGQATARSGTGSNLADEQGY